MDNKYIESVVKGLAPYLAAGFPVDVLKMRLENVYRTGRIAGLNEAANMIEGGHDD